jgi:hypothetical protein
MTRVENSVRRSRQRVRVMIWSWWDIRQAAAPVQILLAVTSL